MLGCMAQGDDGRREELAGFLRAMRERVTPADFGLLVHGPRRTPGLRRQEVAELAAVSIDWYIRLEQGRVGTPGAAVLDGVARALRLSAAEREHLHVLARRERPMPEREEAAAVPPSIALLLRGMPLIPAYVVDHCFRILARNDAAAALFGDGFGAGAQQNTAVLLFEDPEIRAMQLDWERVARETVGNLRANLARSPEDAHLRALIQRLSRDAGFRSWWEDRAVEERAHGVKRLAHPEVGPLTVYYDYLALAERGLRLVSITPVDEPSEAGIRALITQRTRRTAGGGVRALAA
jgi:transcriptional regulator with XRE-family HTH domain